MTNSFLLIRIFIAQTQALEAQLSGTKQRGDRCKALDFTQTEQSD